MWYRVYYKNFLPIESLEGTSQLSSPTYQVGSWRFLSMGRITEVHEINAGISNVLSLLLLTFLLYTNHLTKNILRYLVHIYADDTTVYKCFSKDQDI